VHPRRLLREHDRLPRPRDTANLLGAVRHLEAEPLLGLVQSLQSRLDLREQVAETRETVDETRDRVDELDRELAEQRALVEALAEKQGIDVEAITAEVHVVDAEEVAGDDEDASTAS